VKLGRNDPCICGSGRKGKRCCGVDALRDRLQLECALLSDSLDPIYAAAPPGASANVETLAA